MKAIILLATFALTLTQAFAASHVPGGLPERLDCRLTSVTPRGNGSSFRKNISIVYNEFDPTRPIRNQSEFTLLPNTLPLYYVGVDQNGVQLEGTYKKPFTITENEDAYVLIINEVRGGGTGYGTPGFSVRMRYKCDK